MGVLVVEGLDAARSTGVPVLTAAEVTDWASSQARQIRLEHDTRPLAMRVAQLGGDPAELHLVDSADGLLSYRQIVTWAQTRSAIHVVDAERNRSEAADHWALDPRGVVTLGDDVLDLPEELWLSPRRARLVGVARRLPRTLVLQAVAEAWQTVITDVEVGALQDEYAIAVGADAIPCYGETWVRRQ